MKHWEPKKKGENRRRHFLYGAPGGEIWRSWCPCSAVTVIGSSEAAGVELGRLRGEQTKSLLWSTIFFGNSGIHFKFFHPYKINDFHALTECWVKSRKTKAVLSREKVKWRAIGLTKFCNYVCIFSSYSKIYYNKRALKIINTMLFKITYKRMVSFLTLHFILQFPFGSSFVEALTEWPVSSSGN